MIETHTDLAIGETIEVELPEAGALRARVVWKRDAYFGCEFLSPASGAAVSAALLRSAPKHPRLFSTPDRPKGVPDNVRDSPEPIIQATSPLVAAIWLILVVIVVGVFMWALLTLPFSADQPAR